MRNNKLLSTLLGTTAVFFSSPVASCPDAESMKNIDFSAHIEQNLQARESHISHLNLSSQKIKTRIDNVRIFDGSTILPPSSIAIDGPLISNDLENAQSYIDAKGATLLPGLIDSHCHPSNLTHLQSLANAGVTTGLLMACYSEQLCSSISHIPGLTDLVVGSTAAAAPGSKHGFITSMVDPSLLVNSTSAVPAWMSEQLSWNPDFIKLIAESPGLSQETLNALTISSHKSGKPVAIHASDLKSYRQALLSGADHIQHLPLDEPLLECEAKELAALDSAESEHHHKIKTFTPTLTMLRATAQNDPSRNFSASVSSVSRLYKAFSSSSSTDISRHLPILAGTDANQSPGVPAQVPFGTSLHAELDNLVELAGMTRLEALRAATVEAARAWGLDGDRGAVKEGMRADLVLVEGDLLGEGKESMGEVLGKGIRRVWVGGVEVGKGEI